MKSPLKIRNLSTEMTRHLRWVTAFQHKSCGCASSRNYQDQSYLMIRDTNDFFSTNVQCNWYKRENSVWKNASFSV